jgi:hypothetical protein
MYKYVLVINFLVIFATNGPYEGLLKGKQHEKTSHWKNEKLINNCNIVINVTHKCLWCDFQSQM